MPASQISLQHLLATASEQNMDIVSFKKEFLRQLRDHQIQATCGEYIKSSLEVIFEEKSMERALSQDFLPNADTNFFVLKQASAGASIIRVWAGNNYYTFAHRDGTWQVFTDGDYRMKFPGQEINPSWYPFAWLDDDRYALLCEDLENRSRFVFEKISLNRSDIEPLLNQAGVVPPRKRGPKPQFVDDCIEKKAEGLLLQRPDLRKKDFEQFVRGWLGPERQPGATQFRKLYGYLWTNNKRARKTTLFEIAILRAIRIFTAGRWQAPTRSNSQ